MFQLKSGTLKFMINASIDTLPTPANLRRWKYSNSDKCKLCGNKGTTNHILNCCKIMLDTDRYTWYIPSEKIGQNIDPLRNSFFVANYQHWTSTSALEPFLGPLDPWGALGGPWVVWGGLTTPKLPFSFEDQFKPWN